MQRRIDALLVARGLLGEEKSALAATSCVRHTVAALSNEDLMVCAWTTGPLQAYSSDSATKAMSKSLSKSRPGLLAACLAVWGSVVRRATGSIGERRVAGVAIFGPRTYEGTWKRTRSDASFQVAVGGTD